MPTDGEMNLASAVAIIGMAGRFPQAGNIEEFWKNICSQRECITSYTPDALISAGVDANLVQNPNYIKARGELADIDMFDAKFFGINPKEAELMDPQHRLLLECSWEALENAGYDSERFSGRIGVYAGESMNTYVFLNVYPYIEKVLSSGSLQAAIGNDKDSLTTMIAYKMNLKGPAITIQSSSSTSLTAVCTACQSLLTYQCDMALAGGISAGSPQKSGYLYEDRGIVSPDGHCRPFDKNARGFVPGNGMGVVVLKRLQEAMDDGDSILAVIRGYAVNNDGSAKVSYGAPSVDAQAEVIMEAQAVADVSPETIGYLEAHGTGTEMGDPIEVAALTQAFRAGTGRNNYCALGSVKGNIGHLDTAAGVVGLIKATLALRHKIIPPGINFEVLNPKIDLIDSPFYLSQSPQQWESGPSPRRAGVTSLGMGGTNVHVVLEESPELHKAADPRPWNLLVCSAGTEPALRTYCLDLADYLEAHPEYHLEDVAYTLQIGRRQWKYRRAVGCRNRLEAIQILRQDERQPKDAEAMPEQLAVMGQLWLDGQPVDWEGLYAPEHRRRVPLPTYPFERQSYWLEPKNSLSGFSAAAVKPKADLRIKGRTSAELTACEKLIAECWSEVLGLYEFGPDDNFFEIGGDSILLIRLHSLLEARYPGEITTTDIFTYPTITKLSRYLSDKGIPAKEKVPSKVTEEDEKEQIQWPLVEGKKGHREIAIIGMAVKMPGADNIGQFWTNFRNGVDNVSDLPESRRHDSDCLLKYLNWDPEKIEYAPGGYLQEIDRFDYAFFRMAPKEAALMDPSQRLFLETAWQAMEDAGYGAQKFSGSRTGVYVGFNSWPVYGEAALQSNPQDAAQATLGNLASVIPGRISYLLDLHGPAVMVDTACSSSLTAVHLACQGIRNGDCELALAGGVNLRLIPLKDMGALGIESTTNRTRTFDHASDGTVWGEGVAAILLKPLAKALADGDHIEAVIKGSSLNHDGSSIGLTAPNVLAQEDMLVKAWRDFGINPETITYIEAHGTGTPLGDPIEIEAITKGFRHFTDKKQFCAIGSAKSNFGHLDGASGIAGLIKAVLALKHKEIPPSLHFRQPNRKINFAESPVYVNDHLCHWTAGDSPRRAGVNSFGLSGANCHVVLEEPPELQRSQFPARVWHLLTISAKSLHALQNMITQYQAMLEEDPPTDLNALCYTACAGRGHYEHRLALIFGSLTDLGSKLTNLDLTGSKPQNTTDIFYGQHKIIPETKRTSAAGELTMEEWRAINTKVRNILEPNLNFQDLDRDFLMEIAKFYIQGAHIEWSRLYPSGNRMRLPVYPFEKNRCWLELPEKTSTAAANAGPSAWCYHTVWRIDYQRVHARTPQSSTNDADVILLSTATGGDDRFCEKLGQRFETLGKRIIRIKRGSQLRSLDANNHEVSGSIEDFQWLFESRIMRRPTQIILMTTGEESLINDRNALDASQEIGIVTLDNLTRALTNLNVKHELDLALVAVNVNQVTGNEKELHPEWATLFGLGKVIRMEHPNFHCRCIDIDERLEVDELILELKNPARDYMVAFREGTRYLEELSKLDLAAAPGRELQYRSAGVYVITGGTGGIGLAISSYLARKSKVNLALIQRSPLPERSEWDGILARDEEPRLCRALKTILEIEAAGAEVMTYAIDISDELKMKGLFNDLRRKYGRINGVVHSAGLPGDGMNLAGTLLPKVQGAWMLHQLTMEDDLDFFLMFSSGMTLTGGIGVGAYTAANSYLDSFAAYRRRRKPHERAVTINWPTWRDSVMKGARERLAEERQLFKFISNQEAVDLLDQVLRHDVSRVIIGQLNFQSAILYFQEYLPFQLSPELKNSCAAPLPGFATKDHVSQQSAKEVRLTGRATGVYSELEKSLGKIWGEVLGFEEINIDDSFYDLGGDSIKAVQVIARLPQYKLDIVDTLRYPTIAGLSEYLGASYPTVNHVSGPEENIEAQSSHQDFEYLSNYPPVKILENINPFTDVLYKDCFYNAFFPVIRHFGGEIQPFLADDLAVYQYHSGEDTTGLDIHYLNRQGIEPLLAQMGITLTVKTSVQHFIPELVRALADNHPVIVRVDCFYEPNRFDMFREDHWEHCLLIYGYDQTAQVFHCLEHEHINSLSYKPLLIGYHHLFQAYRGYLRHFHQDPAWPSFYEFAPATDSTGEWDGRSNLRESVLAHKDRLINQFTGLAMFEKEWRQWIARPDDLARVIDQLVYLVNKILKAKTSQQYQIRNLLPEEAGLLQSLAEIITHWNYLKVTVEKYKYSRRFQEGDFTTAHEKLMRITHLEKDFWQEFVRMIEW